MIGSAQASGRSRLSFRVGECVRSILQGQDDRTPITEDRHEQTQQALCGSAGGGGTGAVTAAGIGGERGSGEADARSDVVAGGSVRGRSGVDRCSDRRGVGGDDPNHRAHPTTICGRGFGIGVGEEEAVSAVEGTSARWSEGGEAGDDLLLEGAGRTTALDAAALGGPVGRAQHRGVHWS